MLDEASPEARSPDFGWMVSILSGAFARWGRAAVTALPRGPRGYLVLDALSRGQPPSQLALARALGVDKTAMTYLLDEMEDAKLVHRRRDPADRRARQVALTAKGQRALEKARAQLDVTEERLLSVLSAKEAGAFREMLERVTSAAHEKEPDVGAMNSSPPPGI